MGSAPSAVRPLSNEPQDSIDWQRETERLREGERGRRFYTPPIEIYKASSADGPTSSAHSLVVLVMGRKGHRAFGENKEEGRKGEGMKGPSHRFYGESLKGS